MATFDQRHCDRCLAKTSKTGVVTYFHYVLEAKLLTSTGQATSLQRFTYITNISQTNENVVQTADSGRIRWKIENEGFNAQKNLGYALEHKFSRKSFMAMQNYYHLLQIAHLINQLAERTKQVAAILGEHSKQTIVDLWKKMMAYLTIFPCQENIQKPYQPG